MFRSGKLASTISNDPPTKIAGSFHSLVLCVQLFHTEMEVTEIIWAKSIGKSISAYGFEKSQEKNLRIRSLDVCDFQKENQTLGHGFKNL